MALSLSASRADNFYYPPGYDGKKHGSLDKFQGSHPLGDRAKKLHEGILVIRFEMPFKVWCLHCNCIIDQGVRFNAEKKTVGKYFTTNILHFRMQCKKCSGFIAVQTNPKTTEYELVEGLRMKLEEFSAKDAETIELVSTEEKQKRETDPMYRLEATTAAKEKTKGEAARIQDLYDLQKEVSRDNYSTNSDLRSAFRKRKVEELEEERKAKKKKNFAMPLLPIDEEDEEEANETFFETDTAHIKSKVARAQAEYSSIFPSNNKTTTIKKRTSSARQSSCNSNTTRTSRGSFSCSSNTSTRANHHSASSSSRKHRSSSSSLRLHHSLPATSSSKSSTVSSAVSGGGGGNRLERLVARKAELELMRRREGKPFPLTNKV
eukprot:GHVS01019272.1.p1 GENE.GHVS01019272.1~~GHVS01019272.1.p1  ORF type:complete len:443 (+),score=84.68 GHVS01019272.1:200-1330(+)